MRVGKAGAAWSRSCVRPSPGTGRPRVAGFTLLEVTVVLLVVALTLAIGAQGYGVYLTRTAARRSAQLFAMDLALARSTALRTRSQVVVRVNEPRREYQVETSAGEEVVSRDYGAGQDVRLDTLELRISGDSMLFNGRGILDLSGAGGALGSAVFKVGDSRYEVYFNAMGAARIDAS